MSAYVFSNIDSMHRLGGGSDSDANTQHYRYAPHVPTASAMVPLQQHDHRQQQQFYTLAPPPPQPPTSEFICNVSDDDTVERDIDMEIEARIRSLTFLSDDADNVANLTAATTPTPATTTVATNTPTTLPRTMSQRMLSSLQKSKQRSEQHPASASSSRRPTPATATTSSSSRTNAPPVRNEQSFYALPQAGTTLATATPSTAADSTTAPAPRDDALWSTHLSTRSFTTCADRLEARISKSFLTRQDSIEESTNDLYSGRRTYPAESRSTTTTTALRKNDARRSESMATRTNASQQQPTAMDRALERQRTAMALAGLDNVRPTHTIHEPLVMTTPSKDAGVSFRFHGPNAAAAPTNKQPLHQSLALVAPSRRSNAVDPQFGALASQLCDIATLVDSIESCLHATLLPSLAAAITHELDLLRGAAAQIRSSGATMLLAAVGQPLNETTHALRELVARAASMQQRIEAVIASTTTTHVR